MDGVLFLSHYFFGMRQPALELAGHSVELGLGGKMETSRRVLAD